MNKALRMALAATLVVAAVAGCTKKVKEVPPSDVPPDTGATTGGIVDKTLPIHQSNIAIFNPATGKADRVGVKFLADKTKVRVFKSSGEEIKA